MTPLMTLAAFVFLMAYYFFVLRKYNSLGFRMLSLFTFVGLAVTYWTLSDHFQLKDVEKNGIKTQAVVVANTRNGVNNVIRLRFTDATGKVQERTEPTGVSDGEAAAVTVGSSAPILYSPKSDAVYLASSYNRQLADNLYILFFPAALFLIGILCYIFLRQYKVEAHEGTMYEYVTDEKGTVVLDDAKNSTTKALRVGSTLSKFLQIFRS